MKVSRQEARELVIIEAKERIKTNFIFSEEHNVNIANDDVKLDKLMLGIGKFPPPLWEQR